jgi:hypothetical protein
VNAASGQGQTAYKNLAGSLTQPSNALSETGKQIGSALSNKDTIDALGKVYNKLFGSSGSTYDATKGDAFAQNLQQYNNPANDANYFRPTPTGDTWG